MEDKVRKRAISVFELADAMFLKQFRLSKPAFKYLLDNLEENLKAGVRSTHISSENKLATFLRFLAEGGYQNGAGNDYNIGLAQPTVSVV